MKPPEEPRDIEQVCEECAAEFKARLQRYIDQPAAPVLAELRATLEKVLAEWAAAEPVRYEVLTETKPDGTLCVAATIPDPRTQPFTLEFTLSKAEDEKP